MSTTSSWVLVGYVLLVPSLHCQTAIEPSPFHYILWLDQKSSKTHLSIWLDYAWILSVPIQVSLLLHILHKHIFSCTKSLQGALLSAVGECGHFPLLLWEYEEMIFLLKQDLRQYIYILTIGIPQQIFSRQLEIKQKPEHLKAHHLKDQPAQAAISFPDWRWDRQEP